MLEVAETTAGREDRRWPRLIVPDLLLPSALAMWAIGLGAARPGAVNQYGLLPGLPRTYFAGFVLLVISIGILLARRELSGPRLALHLIALILMIHGTAPLVFAEPRYAWTYKHIGVVQYINLHGALDASIDIYHNWPGFFALAAWFGRIAGINTPLAYAAWAQLFFSLLTCLELGFALRALPLTDRERWLALFLFVASNWVGQDYFAPQALGLVLSMGVFAIALHWLRGDRRPRWIAWVSLRIGNRLPRARERVEDVAPRPLDHSQVGAIAVLLGVYFVLVFTHELSPYIVVLQMTGLTLVGRIRPRWVVLAMWTLCLAYLIPRFELIDNTYHIVTALSDPFRNLAHSSKHYPPGLPGRRLAADAARALSLGMWALALLGVGRRLREGRQVLPLMILAFAPAIVVFAHSYGGEAVYRVYLFSIPWTACLVASLLRPDPDRHPRLSWLVPPVALLLTVGLLFPSFFGLDFENAIPAAEVRASTYFYSHAEPGVLLGSYGFPTRLAANYEEFVRGPNDTDPNFLSSTRLWGRMLGANDLPTLANKIRYYAGGEVAAGYLVLSTSQSNTATLFGILPEGSFASLERALLYSPDWTVFYRNSDTIIFQLHPSPVEPPDSASRQHVPRRSHRLP